MSARLLIALLALVILGEVLAAVALHEDRAELERGAHAGTPRERAFALHVLANRDEPVIYGAREVEELLASEEELLREFAMTYDFSRADGAARQREFFDDHPEEARARFFLHHQKLPMFRKHVTKYFAGATD